MKQKITNSIIRAILNTAGLNPVQSLHVRRVLGSESHPIFQITNRRRVFGVKPYTPSEQFRTVSSEAFYRRAAARIRVPTFIARGKTGSWSWIIYRWKQGVLLYQLPSHPQRLRASKILGRQLRRLHTISVQGYGWMNLRRRWAGKTNRTNINFFLKRVRRLAQKNKTVFRPSEIQQILRLTLLHPSVRRFSEPRLLHGDCTGGNVIVTGGTVTLLDPGEVIAGDPMADLAYTQLSNRRIEFQSGVWEGYTKHHPLSVAERERFLRWQLVRQLIVTLRLEPKRRKRAARITRTLLKDLQSSNPTPTN
jgi:fructosamine-3-kinase